MIKKSVDCYLKSRLLSNPAETEHSVYVKIILKNAVLQYKITLPTYKIFLIYYRIKTPETDARLMAYSVYFTKHKINSLL